MMIRRETLFIVSISSDGFVDSIENIAKFGEVR